MADGHGGYRPGSGRPKGTHTGAQLKSRLSPEQQARAAEAVRLANEDCGAFPGDAYALLVWIYRSADLPITLRMRAAETAIAYERPKLAQVEMEGDDQSPMKIIQNIMQMLEGTGRGLPSESVCADGTAAPAANASATGHSPPTPPSAHSGRRTVQETVHASGEQCSLY